jgi:Thioesterase-like superfamily
MKNGFFQVEGGVHAGGGDDSEVLLPLPWSHSGWGGARLQIRGGAVSGALARAAERAAHSSALGPGFRPVRWTLDLFRPAAVRPSIVITKVVRKSRRLCLVDAVLTQDDTPVARGTALFLAAGGPVYGKTWATEAALCIPPPDLRPSTTEPRLYYSEGVGWTGSPTPHQNAARKQTWHFPAALVEDEKPTGFQQATMVADVANLVTNWGDNGMEFINTDITLALARLPESLEVGIAAEYRSEDDGVAVGTAMVFDRQGVLGTATVTALANGTNAIDPRLTGDPI